MSFFVSHLYSQTDPRWSNELLGFSSVTIGGYGCAITAVANLHNLLFDTNITPSAVNKKLKRIKGFAFENRILWSKVQQAFPKLKFVSRDWSYNNVTVFKWLNVSPRVPVIIDVKTKFVPQHFVVFIGKQQMVDSLDGKIKPTSTYPVLRGSVRYTRS